MPLRKTIALCFALCFPAFSAVMGWYNGSPQIAVGSWAIRNQYVVNFPETCPTAPHCLFGIYDDFVVPAGGWTVVGVLSHNYMNSSSATQAYWEIRSGVSVGTPGTLVASGVSPATQTWFAAGSTGWAHYEIQVNGLKVGLAAGKYWLLVAPVGAGYSYIDTTNGAGALGSPAGNDGQACFTGGSSDFMDSTAVEPQSPGSRDFSLGVLIADPPSPTTGAPVINDGGIVIHGGSAAAVSPGSLVDIYGTNLAAAAVSAPAGATLPTTLGGVKVSVNGTAAPLVYAGPGQIICQLPYETAVGAQWLTVVSNDLISAAAPVVVQQAAPSILAYGSNWAVAVNPDGSINGPGNGARPGTAVVAYLIGSGPLDNPIPTGAAAPLAPLSREKLPATVWVGGSPATVQFFGMAPAFVGLMQLNFTVPPLGPGQYPIQVTLGGVSSNAPMVTVAR